MFLNVYFDLIIFIFNEKKNISILVNYNVIDLFCDVMVFVLKCIYINL